MAQPYNSNVGQQNKAGGRKVSSPKPASTPAMPYKCANWPAPPKGRGPNRNSWSTARKIEQFPKSEGI